jgi:hypothetical protein
MLVTVDQHPRQTESREAQRKFDSTIGVRIHTRLHAVLHVSRGATQR